MNSEEEEEAEERAAQRELKNGLKNISFADDVEVTEIDGYESIFKGISFANASRGIQLCFYWNNTYYIPHPSIYPSIYLSIHSFVRLFVYSFVCSFIRLFIHNPGILKNVSTEEQLAVEGEVDEEGNPIEPEEQEETSGNHKLTQLNGPVIDPTFSGRDNQQAATARIPFPGGKKKPVS